MDTIKIVAVNGSPRKNFNTAELLKYFLKGAESIGNNVEAINSQVAENAICVKCGMESFMDSVVSKMASRISCRKWPRWMELLLVSTPMRFYNFSPD